MTISDDLRMYLQERRRALLYEIEGIETLIGIAENRRRRAERREGVVVRRDEAADLDPNTLLTSLGQGIRRG